MSDLQALRDAGHIFGIHLYCEAADGLTQAVEAGTIHAGDLYGMLTYMRDRATGIVEKAAELATTQPLPAVTLWMLAAKESFRLKAESLFVGLVLAWKKQAPHGKRHFTVSAKKNVPLACLAVIFPADFGLTDEQDADLRRVFDILAKLADLRPFDEADLAEPLAA